MSADAPVATGEWGSGWDLAGNLADPLGLYTVASDLVDPDYNDTTLNDQLGKLPKGPERAKPPTAEEAARASAFDSAKKNIRQRRAASTLLSSGTGTLDAPTTASSTLLGV